MIELIFRITCKLIQIEAFIHRYARLFNEYYSHRNNKAYFEVIENGFLYILPDLDTYIRIAESIPPHSELMNLIETHKNERTQLASELLGFIGFSIHDQVLLDVEVRPYTTDQIMPIMKKVFFAVNADIIFTSIDNHRYIIQFPHMDAFLDYYTIFLLSIRTPSE